LTRTSDYQTLNERFEQHVRRRFLLEPGITGLRQVSAGSALSCADSVRLRLSHVENPTPLGDMSIQMRAGRGTRSVRYPFDAAPARPIGNDTEGDSCLARLS
jgi:hypothetical protein